MTAFTTMVRRRLPLALGLLVLGGCSETKQDVFHPDGPIAEKINQLQVPMFFAAGLVGVVVAALLTYVIVTGRRRGAEEDGDPPQVHGNFTLEIAWTIVPTLILIAIAIPTVFTILDISDEPDDALRVKVFGHQWWWSYEYDVDGDGDSDVVTANELVIPAGEPVVLEVSSRDVIHSFWIPDLAGARDVAPGRVHVLQIEADEPGEWFGQCKEYCGLSHANMRAKAIALTRPDFDHWLAENQRPAATPGDGTAAAAGAEIFVAKCASCHQIDGLETADGEPIEVEGRAALVAGAAPNLTHLMSRKVFASAEFQLWIPDGEGGLIFNRNQVEAWLRDPPAMLPMAPDEQRGMPNLELTEAEIDQLVAYLQTLGPYPDGAVEPEGGN